MPTTRVALDAIRIAIETQHSVLREEVERAEAIENEIEQVKARIEVLRKEYDASTEKQKHYSAAVFNLEQLILSAEPSAEKQTSSNTTPKPIVQPDNRSRPARFGTLRYRIFYALRLLGNLHLGELADAIHAPTRRVKGGMVEDLESKLIVLDDNGYSLTPAGEDLLARFEAYRTTNKIEMPPLASAPEEEQDEGEAEASAEVESFIGEHDPAGYSDTEPEEQADDSLV